MTIRQRLASSGAAVRSAARVLLARIPVDRWDLLATIGAGVMVRGVAMLSLAGAWILAGLILVGVGLAGASRPGKETS